MIVKTQDTNWRQFTKGFREVEDCDNLKIFLKLSVDNISIGFSNRAAKVLLPKNIGRENTRVRDSLYNGSSFECRSCNGR